MSARRRFGAFIFAGLLVALVLAGVASGFASSAPDGLDSVVRAGCVYDGTGQPTGGSCLAQLERPSQTADSPLAEYGVRGVDNPYVATGLAGVTGVLVTFGLGGAFAWLAGRRPGPAAAGSRRSDGGPAT